MSEDINEGFPETEPIDDHAAEDGSSDNEFVDDIPGLLEEPKHSPEYQFMLEECDRLGITKEEFIERGHKQVEKIREEAGKKSREKEKSSPRDELKSQREKFLSLFEKAEGLGDIDLAKYPEIKWTVKDILPPGFGIFSGGTKLGKTFLCQQLLSDVSMGGNFLGNPDYPCAKGEGLFLVLQLSSRLLHNRMEEMEILADNRIQVLHEWPRGEDGIVAVRLWKELHPKCILVIVDMFEQVRDRGGSSDDAYSANVREIAAWTKAAQDLDITIMGTFHDKKLASMDFVSDIMGSLGTAGSAATIWALKRARGKKEAVLNCVGWEVIDHDLPLIWEEPGSWKLQEGTALERAMSQERSEIIDALRDEPMRPKQLAEILGKKANAIWQLLSKMKNDDQVETREGKYHVL